jgi:lipopolysaccharide export system protein LptA
VIRFALALAALFVLATPALAQSFSAEGGPVEVTADQFVVDQASGNATFTGKVRVLRSDLTMWADKLLVEYADDSLSSIDNMIATGNVRLKTEDQDATGDRAVFDPRTQVLRLTGNVVVVSDAGTVNGPELVIDLENNLTTFNSTGSGRVTGVFTPSAVQ